MTPRLFSCSIATAVAAVSLAAAVATAQTPAAQPAPVSSPAMKAYMKDVVDPAANAVFAAGNDAPEGETPAQAAARWKAAEEGARTLKAAAVRLQQPDFRQPGDWAKFNTQLAEAAAAGETAAKAKNTDAAFTVGGQLYDSCNDCHHLYQAGRR